MREDKVRADKRKKRMGWIMTVVMFGSVFTFVFFGFGTGGLTGSVKYNDFKFINKGVFWSTTVNEREALFTYFPDEVGLIIIDGNIIDRLKDKVEIDVTSDFNDTFAEEISLAGYNMGLTLQNFNVFVRSGFSAKNEYNFPAITCEDSSDTVPVIFFRSANETKVYLENDCIIAESSNRADFERIKDRLVYGILGII